MRIDYDKDQLAYALANALRERDEARDDADHWKIEYEIVVSRLCGVKHDRDNGVIFEHEIIPKLQRERDEALEKLSARWQSLRDSQDEVLRLTFENRELSQERDEAREQAQQMSESNQLLMADVRFYRNAWEEIK